MSVSVVVRVTVARRPLFMCNSSLSTEAGRERVRPQTLLVGDGGHRGRERGGSRTVEFYHSHTLAKASTERPWPKRAEPPVGSTWLVPAA